MQALLGIRDRTQGDHHLMKTVKCYMCEIEFQALLDHPLFTYCSQECYEKSKETKP